MKILKFKKIYLGIAVLLVSLSWISILVFGLNLGIDFKGGTVYEVKYISAVPEISAVKNVLKEEGFRQYSVQKLGNDSFVIKMAELTDSKKKELEEGLSFDGRNKFEEVQLRTISSSISKEFLNKSIWAIILVSISIVLFIAYVFRGVSYPVSSSIYGLIAIIALIHDISIPAGFFAFMGSFNPSFEINVLFVTAILAILGYSVNDTIVVFDRIRENLKKEKNIEKIKGEKFKVVVEKSLKQTIRRSVFTSFTTLIVLISLYIFGGENTKNFSLVLVIGVIAGTYSSIFLASPLLVCFEKRMKKKTGPKKDLNEMTEEERIRELTDV